MELQSVDAQFGSCDVEIWRITLKNNTAHILSNIKLCASFRRQMWIQTGVTVRKRQSGVTNCVTLTFDLWPRPFAWTSHRSLVIIPEHFRMIRWGEYSETGVADGRTDRRTERQTAEQTKKTIHRVAWSQLKIARKSSLTSLGEPYLCCWRSQCSWHRSFVHLELMWCTVGSQLSPRCWWNSTKQRVIHRLMYFHFWEWNTSMLWY